MSDDEDIELATYSGLLLRDVRWLRHRCPNGRRLCSSLTETFLEGVDPDEPVFIRRLHPEGVDMMSGDPEVVLVVLAWFHTRGGGWYLNEFACYPDDYRAVVKQIGRAHV